MISAEKPTDYHQGEDEMMLNVDLASPEPSDAVVVGNGKSASGVAENGPPKKQCCSLYDGNVDAIGYSWLAAGRGMMVMSNIFMSSSLLWLSSNAAGCFDDDGEALSATTEEVCDKKVYGFTPSSLITNIAVIAGLLSAFFMPICGALVDFTPYRRLIGIVVAIILIIIQAIQIYTVEQTWFAMAILQSIAAFFYQLQVVAVFAYLPDIAREVGQTKMNRFSSNFTSIQFLCQAFFLVLIVGISIGLETSDVVTAQISQAINTCTSILFFSVGWFKYMTHRPAARDLPEGHSLLTEGFRQNWDTAKCIQRYYKNGLRWYLLAIIFAEASAAAITTVSVVYLNDTLKMNSTEIGIFFLVTLVGTLPGTQIAWRLTRTFNPNTSWKISMIFLFIVLMIGALVLELEGVPSYCSYIWGFFIGLGLGWYYPTENLFFSMCLPKGQEAELAGFFVYCTQIMSWLPPLLFTLLMEVNVPQKYGVILVSTFFLVAVGLLMFTCSWDEIVEEANSGAAAAAAAAAENTSGGTSGSATIADGGKAGGDDGEIGRDVSVENDEA